MILVGQTRFTSPSIWYDTEGTSSSGSGIVKTLMGILKPYAKIQQGNLTLYEFNKPYPDESAKWKFLAVMTGGIFAVGVASLLFGLGRATKK